MPKPFKQWTVLPHGKLSHLEDNLLSVTGELHMPLGDYPRRMTVARLRDGRLVIYSAIALDEPEMRALEAFGEPSFLVVPGELHRLDAKVWCDRYPQLRVVAPPGIIDKVEEVVRVDQTTLDFEDMNVRFIVVPGTRGKEAALLVKSAGGTTLVVNDLIWNLEERPGLGGWILGALGFTGDEPKIPPVIRMGAVKDRQALGQQLAEWSRIPDLHRIIVSHGRIVSRDVSGVLDGLARDLGWKALGSVVGPSTAAP